MKRPLLYNIMRSSKWYYNKFYMKYVPGTTIKVRWPKGEIIVTDKDPRYDPTMSAVRYVVESADPNDHYRPWIEKHVGKQGIDWQWDILGSDLSTNTLSIKFRKGKEKYASLAMIQWG